MDNLAKHPVNYNVDYLKVLKELIVLLRPYETRFTVAVLQEDSFCLYTGNPVEAQSELFAAAQIMKNGVALTLYLPSRERRSLYEILGVLSEFKTGINRFTFTKLPGDLKSELKQLISFLFMVYE